MLLSPLAAPFQPQQGETYKVQGMAICNDGEPVMVGVEDEILHNIADSAFDENFPPDAQEAAELEAVEFYVDMLATLSILEDREQQARDHFTGFGKRWEARRGDGLVGKPRLAKNLISAVNHHSTQVGKPLQSSDLVSFAHSNRDLATALLESRRQQRQEFKRMNNKSNMVNNRGHVAPKPLQQPRKQYA